MAHRWGKLCGLNHYNVQYVVFIGAYTTLKCYNKHHILYIVMVQTTKFTAPMCHELYGLLCDENSFCSNGTNSLK
jgi:hypothetical protein